MLARGQTLYVTFIDYSAAFDTISHKFLDRTLAAAKASNKTRAMFRSIYRAASAVTVVEGIDGKPVTSEVFPVNRGVVQGDITSPLYFILALEMLFRLHDTNPNKGVDLGGHNVHSLGYADDAALLDSKLAVATDRVTAIAQGSRTDADMSISIDKTEVMQVTAQGAVTPTTSAEAKKVCKHKCRYAGCGRVFRNKHGLKCHEGKCKWRSSYWKKNWTLERILAVRDKAGTEDDAVPVKEFKIRWEGCDEKGDPWPDTWEPREHIHPDEVKQFLQQNDLYDYNWSKGRCPYFDRKCKSQYGVKIHMHHCLHRPDQQKFAGTCADRKVKKDKQELAQKSKPKAKCETHELKNVLRFKYLGSIFSADGQHIHDVV